MQLYDDALNATIRRSQSRLRLAPPSDSDLRVQEIRKSPLGMIRYSMLIVMMPSLYRSGEIGEVALSKRDAILVAIALEQHRRRLGTFPATLTALVPSELAQLPVDPITGGPLGYRLIDNRPLIYSTGVDRDDDSGRTPPDKGSTSGNHFAIGWVQDPSRPPIDGDWVLYPTPPLPVP